MITTKNNKKISIEFDEIEMKILEDSVNNPLAWIETDVTEKIANGKSRLKSHWHAKFDKEKSVTFIPTDESALLTLIFSQPDYKNKAARDEEDILKLKKNP